jgi:hypothetical protein
MLAASYEENRSIQSWLVEPVVLLVIIWGLAFFLA